MSESWRRHVLRALTIVCACAVASGTAGAVPAVAKPVGGKAHRVVAEPGWPQSHEPENDPKPGEKGYLAGDASVVEPPEGMSDDALIAADPAGYAKMREQRDRIERSLLAKARTTLRAAGVTPASEGGGDGVNTTAASVALASTAVSPYGYLSFWLTPNTTSVWSRAGYLGTLYFSYGLYSATTDSYRWYTVAWPARSGDNIPSHQSWVGVGPIPAYTYDFGFMYGAYRGFEWDGREEFSPGKWRLDPWVGAPYGRSCLEVHGGIGAHEFAATSGCIRIHPTSISSLRSYYIYKMANKYDRNSAHLIVRY